MRNGANRSVLSHRCAVCDFRDNQNKKRRTNMSVQLANTRGHYPAGYPRGGGPGGMPAYDPRTLEKATDALSEDQLQTFKTAVQESMSTSAATDYFARNSCARDWWYARWPLQTVDG